MFPPILIFYNYKDLVRKSVLCPPDIEPLTVPPPISKSLTDQPNNVCINLSVNRLSFEAVNFNIAFYDTNLDLNWKYGD